MITYKLESHLFLIKIFTRDFYFRDLVEFCLIFIFGAAFLVTSQTVCAVIWWQQCTYLWTLHSADWRQREDGMGSLPHFWWTLWKKNICVRKTFTETTVELQTMWWILLLFQLSSHYSPSSIGLLPHLLLIIIHKCKIWCTNN